MRDTLTYTISLPGGVRRLGEAALVVCARSVGMPCFDGTKLNAILWHADFSAFAERGVPVTGRAYQRLAGGPAPVEMAGVLGGLQDAGRLAIAGPCCDAGPAEGRPVALAPPDLHWFDEADLVFLARAVDRAWDDGANGASDGSRGVAWRTRHNHDPMPYEGALLSDATLGDHVVGRLLPRARERGWTSL